MQEMEKKPRGSQPLARAHNPVNNLEKLKDNHKKVSKEPFLPPTVIVTENAGCVVFKGKKVEVLF